MASVQSVGVEQWTGLVKHAMTLRSLQAAQKASQLEGQLMYVQQE